MNCKMLYAALLLFKVNCCSSFPEFEWVESSEGVRSSARTDISFVRRYEPNPIAKKEPVLSSDSVDKLDTLIEKEELVRQWIDTVKK